MSFNSDVSNLAIREPNPAGQHYPVQALRSLNPKGLDQIISGQSIPVAPPFHWGGHLQGVAVKEPWALLSTNPKGSYLVRAERENADQFKVTQQSDILNISNFKHLGGIQTIGNYLALPAYKGWSPQIQFHKFDSGWIRPIQLQLSKNSKPRCVGITNATDKNQGDYYVMAVVLDALGNKIRFFRTPYNVPLDDPTCKFQEVKTWLLKKAKKKYRKNWYPDKKWGGYGNSISLFADKDGGVYLLGLHNKNMLFPNLGSEWFDLFKVNLNAPPKTLLTKLAKLKTKNAQGTSSRWGASATVVTDEDFEVYACERNVTRKNRIVQLSAYR